MFVFCVFAVAVTGGWATTRNVPSQYSTIQAAINACAAGDVVVVAQGTYRERIIFPAVSITVRSVTPTSATVRQATIIDGTLGDVVVRMNSNVPASSVLSGFTIKRGQVGVLCYRSSPTISYCSILANTGQGVKVDADWYEDAIPNIIHNTITGNTNAGILCERTASPLIENNLISANTGRGINSLNDSSPLISTNTIFGNSGGGINCGDGIIEYNVINGNSAGDGGGIYVYGQNCSINNNLIWGNVATSDGGGMYVDNNPSIANNTISDNQAQYGGNLCIADEPTLRNCIITFAKSGGGIKSKWGGNSLTIWYSDVSGNSGGDYLDFNQMLGGNNLSADPLFVSRSATSPNYRLKSVGGHWVAGTTFAVDTVHSPCIDTGDPNWDYLNEPSPNGGRINMGYDGNTAQASKSGGIAPRVTAWTPQGTVVSRTANITLTFNVPMNKTSVQNSFSLCLKLGVGEYGTKLAGVFTWSDARHMTFNPSSTLYANKYYRILLKTSAQSKEGVRMATTLNKTFRTVSSSLSGVSIAAAPTANGLHIATNLSAPANVRTVISNIAGRVVAELPEQALPAGLSSLSWNGRSTSGTAVPAGTYLVRVVALSDDGTSAQAMATVQMR